MQVVARPMTEPAPCLWTVEEFYRPAEAGILGPEERVELIDGEILRMSPIDRPHLIATRLSQSALEAVFGEGWVVFCQASLTLDPQSEPYPDLFVVHGEARDYIDGRLRTAELVVEIAESSLQFGRERKASLYARAGIAEYWIVNLIERVLEVHREPEPAAGKYRTVFRLGEEETVSPLAAPDAVIAVRDLLP